MAGKIVPQSDPPPINGNPPKPPQSVWLAVEEWQEISDCASALFAALKCFEERKDEVWDLVVAVQQRFQRALQPIDERLSDELHGSPQ